MIMIPIRMTFITVAVDNDDTVAVDTGDQLVIVGLFSNLFIIIVGKNASFSEFRFWK